MKIPKEYLQEIVDNTPDGEAIDLDRAQRDYERELAEYEAERIEELEERQSQSGFYAFQDACFIRRLEQ
ncbi:MAG: hypothetical protein II896_03885 [Clostridia bacterium]|nr:hypothetical protein [Clostridia bacterium]